jgi:hypothetical protein
MPDNVVHIQFIAETGQLSSAFQAVNYELLKLSSSGGKFGAPIAEGAKKVTAASKEGAEHLGLFGKQADKVREQFKDFGKEALSTATKFIGLAAAFEVVKHAFEAAGSLESARMHLKNILGGEDKAKEVIESLEKQHVASPAMMEQAGRMAAAGVSTDKLAESLRSLRNISKSTGSDLGELVDIYDRIQLRGEVTSREMIRLTMASGGATRALAQEYSHLKPNLELQNLAIEKAALEQENLFKKNEKQIAAVDSLNAKVGFSAAVFKEWEKNMNRTSLASVAGFGGTAVLGMSTKQIAEFDEGIKAIAEEWGLSEAAVKAFVKAGTLGMADVTEAATKHRATVQELSAQQSKATEVANTANEKLAEVDIFKKIQTALGDATTTEAAFAEYQKTFAGQVASQQKKLEELFEQVGKPLIANFKAIEIAGGAVVAIWTTLKGIELFKGVVGILTGVAKGFGLIQVAAEAAAVAETAAAAAAKAVVVSTAAAPAVGAAETTGLLIAKALPVFGAVATGIVLAHQISVEGHKPEVAAKWVDEMRAKQASKWGHGGTVEGDFNPANFPSSPALLQHGQAAAAKVPEKPPWSPIWNPMGPSPGAFAPVGAPAAVSPAPFGGVEGAFTNERGETQLPPQARGAGTGGGSDLYAAPVTDFLKAPPKDFKAQGMAQAKQEAAVHEQFTAQQEADRSKADELREAWGRSKSKDAAYFTSGSDAEVLKKSGITPQAPDKEPGKGGPELAKLDAIEKRAAEITQKLEEIFGKSS